MRMMRGWSMSVTLACMLGVLVPSGGTLAQAAAPPDAKTWVQEHDKNGDGKLDREEFHQAVIESFFFRDTNKVGYLTINELRVVTPEERKALQRSGQLTLQEYLNALHRDFEAADTDRDGLLTVEEIEIYIRNPR
jgi:Ca2+-binding EF-hand superfamily protein